MLWLFLFPMLQALPGWREALPGESGDRSSPQSHEASCSLSATPNDGREAQEAEHAPGLAGMEGQGNKCAKGWLCAQSCCPSLGISIQISSVVVTGELLYTRKGIFLNISFFVT